MMEPPRLPKYDEKDPRYHTARIRNMFGDMIDHLRKDVKIVDDPRAKAMYETSAEVLRGLQKAFEDYEEGTEEAWRR